MHRTPLLLALLATATTGLAQPMGATDFTPRDGCNAGGFATCASVSIHGSTGGLTARVPAASRGAGFEDRRIQLDHGQWGRGPQPLPGAPLRGGKMPCPTMGNEGRNPGDCPAAVTITPEPVSMTLLATGLVGLMGVRRRKPQVTSA